MTNKLKALWAEGKPTLNGWCSIGKPFAAERMAIGSAQNFVDFFAGRLHPSHVVNNRHVKNLEEHA
ncbi:MAG: hypothetical protein ACR2PF_10330 [Rhizobiaceae bacterium]